MITKELTSLQHPIVKHLVKLREKRDYRASCHTAVISGIKLVEELSSLHCYKTLIVEEGYFLGSFIHAEQIYTVTPALLKKITGMENPEPLAAEISLPDQGSFERKNFILILDGVSDPGNMGTLIRTILALGWEGVVITPGSTDPFNEKAIRAAKGATFKMPLKQASWAEVERLLNDPSLQILAADVHGQPVANVRPSARYVLVLGNESQGLSDRLRRKAHCVSIPMKGKMESLNVASAGAILMHVLKGMS